MCYEFREKDPDEKSPMTSPVSPQTQAVHVLVHTVLSAVVPFPLSVVVESRATLQHLAQIIFTMASLVSLVGNDHYPS
jgi:hypothetical protein